MRSSMNELQGKRIAIIVTDGFEQIEMTSPRESLEKAGAKCVLIAPKDGQVQGFKHHDKECIRDHNWVSNRKPDDLPVFNREMVKLFSESRLRAERKEGVEIRA